MIRRLDPGPARRLDLPAAVVAGSRGVLMGPSDRGSTLTSQVISCRFVHVGGRPGFLPTGSNGCSLAHHHFFNTT